MDEIVISSNYPSTSLSQESSRNESELRDNITSPQQPRDFLVPSVSISLSPLRIRNPFVRSSRVSLIPQTINDQVEESPYLDDSEAGSSGAVAAETPSSSHQSSNGNSTFQNSYLLFFPNFVC